jgi:predicted SAM-dependent methyltransferase
MEKKSQKVTKKIIQKSMLKKMNRIVIFIRRILNHLKLLYYRIKYFFFKPRYPINLNSKIYIHLGCGDINSPEFINVDSRIFPHIHHIHNVEYLPMFKNDFADLVYASHVLEHISMLKLKEVLNEWKRVLKPKGVLRLSVPDFDRIIDIYNCNDKNIEYIWTPLLGSQEYKENSHLSVFNFSFIKNLLKEIGFSEIRGWDPATAHHHDFEDWASKNIIINDKSYPISLNVEALK